MRLVKASNRKRVIIITYISAILISIVYFVLQSTDLYNELSNIVVTIVSGLATLTAYLIAQKYRWNIRNKFSRCWLFFFLGSLFWFFGELTWAIYSLCLGVEIPYPSIGDVFWLIAYAPFFMAFLGYFKMFGFPFVSKKKLFVMNSIIFLSSLLILYFVLYPILILGEGPIVLFFNLAYPIGDLLLFTLAFGSLIVFFGQKIGKSYIYLTSAIIMNIIADSLFSFLTITNKYTYGNYLTTLNDLLFLWGYFALFLGFYIHLKEFK
ncbi:MAG: hypothetical protein QXE37_02955 [Nitrososphaerales archaeon]